MIKKLAEADQWYVALFEQARDAIFVLEVPPDGPPIIRDANAAAMRMSGYSRDELIGKPISFLDADAELPDLIAERHSLAQKAGGGVFEVRHRRKDGSVIVVESSGREMMSGGKRMGFVIERDITDRKKVEEEIRMAEARYRSYIEVTGQVGWVTNAAGEIEEDVPSLRRFSGQTYEEAKGSGWVKTLHPDDIEHTLRAWNKAVATKSPYEVEYRMRRHDGAYRHLLARGFPVFKEDGGIREWVGTCIDITERKRVVEKMQWNVALLEAQIRSTDEGILIVDGKGNKILQNDRCVELWGIPKHIVDNKDDKQQVEFVKNRARDPEKFVEKVVYLYSHQDGSSHDEVEFKDGMILDRYSAPVIGKDGTHFGRIWIFRDITGRRKAEVQIREGESRYRTLVETTGTGYVILDDEGKVIDANAEYVRLTGRRELNEILGKSVVEWTADYEKENNASAVRECSRKGFIKGLEIDYVDRKGNVIPIEINATVIGKDGSRMILTLCRDITERRRAAAERDKLQAQLAQAQKMESVGRLAGGVAHDFNNFLSAIKGYGQFVRDALSSEDPRRADAQGVLNVADRAASLTRQLLAFSRRQILSPDVVDINRIVSDMIKMLKHIVPEDVKFSDKLAPRACLAKVDTGQIEQVIMNLALNARDAMPNGGTITISTEIVTLDESFFSARPDLRRGPQVRLRVSDTGCGMTDEVKGRIFEPFYTTKEKGKGTGLGLSTVLGIIKQSGGEIEVESAPGRGATFLVYLPHAQMEAADKDKYKDKYKDKEVIPRGHETVMLVEDEHVIRNLWERALIAQGYTVFAAANGKEALEALERHAKPVDLLITDMVMPGISGRELGKEIARRNMAHRTLYVSGYTDEDIMRHGILEPGLAFLQKPFTPEVLMQKLRDVLDGPADLAKA